MGSRQCYAPAMPQPSEVVIRDLRPSDVGPSVDLLTQAFADFPVLAIAVGHDAASAGRLKRMFAMDFEPDAGNDAIVAELEGEVVGVLTFADSPRCSEMSAGRMLRFTRIVGTRIFGAVRMFGRIDRVHPKIPHRHLPSVGVSPRRQGAGIGRQLMDEFHRRCDADGALGYLETVRWSDPGKPSLERFYQGLGYQIRHVVPMQDDWQVLTMMRSPAAAAEA